MSKKEKEIWKGISEPITFKMFVIPREGGIFSELKLNYSALTYPMKRTIEVSELFSEERARKLCKDYKVKFLKNLVIPIDMIVSTLVHELEHQNLYDAIVEIGYPQYALGLSPYSSDKMSEADKEYFHVSFKINKQSKETIKVHGKKRPLYTHEEIVDVPIPILEIIP